MRLLILCMIVTVSVSSIGMSTKAQTAKDLQSKYGQPAEVFQLNAGLTLTAKYTDDGQTCEVDILQRDVRDLKLPVRHNLRVDAQKLIDQLVPDAKRGRKLRSGRGQIGSCYGSLNEDYEFVSVSKSWLDCGGPFYSARIVWKARPCKGTVASVVSRDIELLLYFTNPKLPEWANSCGAGEFVVRRVAPTKKLAHAALKLLFAGPTVAEQAKGMEGLGPLREYYRGVSIKEGVAVVNFRPGAEKYLHVSGAACEQEQVLTPIVKTLKRFSTIQSVDYAINGKIIEEWDALMKPDSRLEVVAGRTPHK